LDFHSSKKRGGLSFIQENGGKEAEEERSTRGLGFRGLGFRFRV
jgi:hypothetical protein